MSLGEEYRAALLAARATDEAHAVPPVLLGRLVAAGLWPHDRALAYAHAYPDPDRRADALGYLTGPGDHAEAASPVPAEALAAVREAGEGFPRATAYAAAAAVLDESEVPAALDDVRRISPPAHRAMALMAFADRAPGVREEAVAAALEEPGPYGVAHAAALAGPYGVPAGLFEVALEQVGGVTDTGIRGRLVRRLAPWLQDALLPRAESLCRAPVDPYHLAIAFAGLGALGEALEAARAVLPVVPRVQALAYVADEAPEPEQAAILREALGALARVGRHDTRAELIAEVLAPVATGESFDALVAAAEALNNEHDRDTALAGLTEPPPDDDEEPDPGVDEFRHTLATSPTADLLILAGPLARIAGDPGPFLDAVHELARRG